MTVGYKIKNSDGLYSNGGLFPVFNRTGKIWPTHDRLMKHLKLFRRHKDRRKEYDDCVIVEVDYDERPSDIDLREIFKELDRDEVAAKLRGNPYW
jgi:hypothetical protein